jgi:hypothetical protein
MLAIQLLEVNRKTQHMAAGSVDRLIAKWL